MNFEKLNMAILKAGGNSAHFKLFRYLAENSFSSQIKDFRIGHSLIGLFPPHYHPWLSLIFWQAEYAVAQEFSVSNQRLVNPWQILIMLSEVNQIPYGKFLLELNHDEPKTTQELQALVNLDYEGDLGAQYQVDYQAKLTRLLPKNELRDFVIEVVAQNQRTKAASALCQWLNFDPNNCRAILSFFEKCRYS